jgi:lipopolysaccharide biosynthesis glycosyltransferase
MSPETLVMACNEKYVLPAACALYSVGINSPGVIEQVVILGSDLSPTAAASLRRVADEVGLSVEVRDSTALLDAIDVPVSEHISKDAWTRLFIPEVCPELDHYLYGDADLLYLGSLEPLIGVDLEGKIIGAVQDVFHPTLEMDCLPGFKLDEKDRKAPYFNAGILLVDADAWRRADVTTRALKVAQDHPDSMRFWDQDALNAVMIGQWKQLDSYWNVPPLNDLLTTGTAYFTERNQPDRDISEIEGKAQIVHFITRQKPWLSGYPAGEQLNRYQQIMGSVRKIIDEQSHRSAP